MSRLLVKMVGKFQEMIREERGQDLVEYALVVALISFCAIASMRSLATAISTAYTRINTTLSSTIT